MSTRVVVLASALEILVIIIYEQGGLGLACINIGALHSTDIFQPGQVRYIIYM